MICTSQHVLPSYLQLRSSETCHHTHTYFTQVTNSSDIWNFHYYIRFSRSINELPPGQSLEILQLFYQKFTEKYLPILKRCQGRDKKRKIRPRSLASFPHISYMRLESLCVMLQRFIDIFSIILLSISLSTWSGRQKEAALALLLDIHHEMCMPFLCLVPMLVSGLMHQLSNDTSVHYIVLSDSISYSLF